MMEFACVPRPNATGLPAMRSGSANFSFAGAKQQDNDAIVIESAAVVAGFIAEFETLWVRRDNEIYARGGSVSRRP